MAGNIALDLLLNAVEAAITGDTQSGDKVELTADVGALVRDRGMETALKAAQIRQRIGFLTDVANCAEYIRPKHRRRLP
jgi:hypothetical protein